MPDSLGPVLAWAAFLVVVAGLLALDLGVRRQQARRPTIREAATWSLVWFGLAAVFCVVVALWRGPAQGWQFASAYLIEKALSVDNIFVFAVLFQSFAVPEASRHRVLFWGVIGALVMRAAMLLGGTALLNAAHWMIYVFGGVLLLTGWRLLARGEAASDPAAHPLYRLFRRVVPSTPDYHGSRFVIREGGRWLATPLLAVLVLVELTDQLFALDSLPAVLGISRDPFLVVTSNALAVLGMRSLFFCVEGVMQRLAYVQKGLALVLVFVGAKMVLEDVVHVGPGVSLGIIATILGGAVACSVWSTRGRGNLAGSPGNVYPVPPVPRGSAAA